MGRGRHAAAVGAVVAARRARDAIARATSISCGGRRVAAAAAVPDETAGAAAREAPTMRQPPVHSPLPWPALRAGGAALVSGRDPRPALHELLAREFAAERVRLLASGTQALQVALVEAARDVRGDVIAALPAFTCFDVATAAVGAGVRIALYDVDPGTLSPDLDSLTAALTVGARLVVVTPLYGVAVQWRAVLECAAAVGAAVIEDAAQGFGASWLGRPLGSLGAVSVLSFGRGKGWTGGRGGALLARGGAPSSAANGNGAGLWREGGGLAPAPPPGAFARPAAPRRPAAPPSLGPGETRHRGPRPPRSPRRGAGRGPKSSCGTWSRSPHTPCSASGTSKR